MDRLVWFHGWYRATKLRIYEAKVAAVVNILMIAPLMPIRVRMDFAGQL